ncbi:MAG TPA: GntR family transcriptional regulator [Verrucomicrobiae bacterium]|nr:GntR family transcriptional regulator [Verrucomicrobiae bacterium]
MLSLDHKSPVPLRAQVEQLLRDLIQKPEFQNGGLIPDECKLAAQLGVSRGTVRSGISKLVFEGLLQRKAGVGTRVASNHLESGITAWRSFTREMAAKGITVKNYHLNYDLTAASKPAAQGLQIKPETKVWRLERVRGWDGQPILYSVSWFHPRLNLKGGEDFNNPLYATLETATATRPHHAREEFLAVSAAARLSKLLKTPGKTSLLLRRHQVFDIGNQPIEFSEVYYVSSRFTLTLEMRQG